MEQDTVLITGSTGFIGSYLLKQLLRENKDIIVFSKTKGSANAYERTLSSLAFWDKDIHEHMPSNLHVIEADIEQELFGLTLRDYNSLKKKITRIYHAAACTEYHADKSKLQNINVEGSRRIFELGKDCSSLDKVVYISTAYIAGDYAGIFSEKNLDIGQGFKTNYEKSKFDAEMVAREFQSKGVWVDIHRPCAVVGEFETGKIPSFSQTFFQLLHILSLGLFDLFPIGKGIFNLVPVDELIRSILLLSDGNTEKNITFHNFSNERLDFNIFKKTACRFLNIPEPKTILAKEIKDSDFTPAQRIILKRTMQSFNDSLILDSQTTNALLAKFDFKFSAFDMMHLETHLQYLVNTGFIKKRK